MYSENDIINVMKGAALLASGGGGSFDDGMIMLNAYKEKHPGKAIQVDIIQSSEMTDKDYASIVAVMGAPSGGTDVDATPCIVGAFNEIVSIGQRLDAPKTIRYAFPIEMGAFNTLAPMLIQLEDSTIKIIDADAAGRAVPGLETTLTYINQLDTAPIAMCDLDDNRVDITITDLTDAVRIQELAEPLVEIFKQNAGIAGWIMNKSNLTTLPNGTVALARQIGEIISSLTANSDGYVKDLFMLLNDSKIVSAKSLTDVTNITGFQTKVSGGWDIGEFYVGDTTKYHVRFSNESLTIHTVDPVTESESIYMTAPDIISVYDAVTGMPLTNEDLQVLQTKQQLDSTKVVLGVIKVDSKWESHPAKVLSAWEPYFQAVGYNGGIVPYATI
jgi:DUF917 family protein